MKKTLLTGLLSVLVVSPVFAEVDVSTMTTDAVINKAKEICNKHPNTHIWVENDNACVPLDACNDSEYKARYCEKDVFHGISVDTSFRASTMIEVYVERKGLDCKPVDVVGNEVRCVGKDYKVFKFASVGTGMPSFEDMKWHTMAGACFAAGGKLVVTKGMYDHGDGGEAEWGNYVGCLLIDEKMCSRLRIAYVGPDLPSMHEFSCDTFVKLYTNDSFPATKLVSQSVCSAEIAGANKVCIMGKYLVEG